MAYNTDKLFKKACDFIEKDKEILFMSEVIVHLRIAEQTFYDHFPKDSEKLEFLKTLLNENKGQTKKYLRKTFKSRFASSAERIFLYKLSASADEKKQIYETSAPQSIEPIKHNITLNLNDEKYKKKGKKDKKKEGKNE
jgi:hypothetical protein